MRIPDIIAAHVAPGSLIVDLTPLGDVLAAKGWSTEDTGVTYTREAPPASRPVAANIPTVMLHDLAPADSGRPLPQLGAPAPGVVHVVMCVTAEAPMECGLLEAASVAGWELIDTHSTAHDTFRFALVFTAPAPESAATARLRVVNEYRYDKLIVRLRTEHVSRLRRRLEQADERVAEEERLRKEAEARANDALAKLAEIQTSDLEHERAISGRLRERVLSLEAELAKPRPPESSAPPPPPRDSAVLGWLSSLAAKRRR